MNFRQIHARKQPVQKMMMQALMMPLLIGMTTSARAVPILVELNSPVAVADWTRPGSAPENMNVSFVLDTLNMASSSFTFGNIVPGEADCLQGFSVSGANTSTVSVQADGATLWSAGSLTSDYRGNGVNGRCPTGYFADLSFSNGTDNFSWSFDPFPSISEADFLASADPLADLFLGFERTSGSMFLNGDGYRLAGTATATISRVPEPSTLALLAIGFLGMGAIRKLRRH